VNTPAEWASDFPVLTELAVEGKLWLVIVSHYFPIVVNTKPVIESTEAVSPA
jgi:hypothetical protein